MNVVTRILLLFDYRGHNVIDILPTIAMWLLYGLAGMFFTLAAIITLGAIIYPFYMIFDGIRRNLL